MWSGAAGTGLLSASEYIIDLDMCFQGSMVLGAASPWSKAAGSAPGRGGSAAGLSRPSHVEDVEDDAAKPALAAIYESLKACHAKGMLSTATLMACYGAKPPLPP